MYRSSDFFLRPVILTFDVSPARSNIGPTGLVRVHARERIPCHAQAGRPAGQGERARSARARECAGAPRNDMNEIISEMCNK